MQTATSTVDVGERLVADHLALDRIFDQLLDAIHSGDPIACQANWADFERGLLDHIDAEEVYLLPSFERLYKVEAAAIREEHAKLRHLLADMGVRLELHAVKEENVRRLVDALHKHAAREEAVLYRWASDATPDVTGPVAAKLTAGHVRRAS